jgi:hypothetical protein
MPQLLSPAGRWSALIGAAIVAAACADPSTTPRRDFAPSASNANQWPELNGPAADAHIMHTKPWFAANAAGNAGNGRGGGGGGTNNGISYHGGPVLQAQTKVAAVYWGGSPLFQGGPALGASGAGSADGSLVGFFLNHLGGSSYFNINTTYTDGVRNIVNAVSYTEFWAADHNVPASGSAPSDADMLAILQYAFNNNKLTYDAGTLYAIFTPSGVNLGGGFGTQYCAYHYHGSVVVNGTSKNVLYAAMPYNQQYPGICTNGTAAPNGDAGADAEVNTLAHELEETTTDEMGNAWFDVRGYENADKCAWTWGTTQNNGTGVWNITVGGLNFLVQQNWINANGGGCRQSWP